MAVRHYTISQLLDLRSSPLVEKPENLPAIEQWIEYVYLDIEGSREKLRIPHSESQQGQQSQQSQQPQQRQNVTAGRQERPGADASPMGNFSTGARPSLLQTRSTANRSGEDITLGPPKTLFASSRTTSKLSDFVDKPSTPLTEAALNDEQDSARTSRFFGDKQMNRKSLKSGDTDGKHNRESWTQARERRAQGGNDERGEGGDRNGRYGRRDREKDADGERRNGGFGDRQEARWGPKDDKRPNGERQGGWREREKERREKDPWERHAEREPEWMDDPAPKQEEDFSMMSMPRNQEDFEKWKQAQHARYKKPADDMDFATPEPDVIDNETAPSKSAAPFKLEGVSDKPLGGWGESKKGEAPAGESAPTPIKSAPAKGKTSRFMPMFKKDEPVEEQPTFAEPSVPNVQNDFGSNVAEDKEGFQRILQMLGGTGVGPTAPPAEPASPPPKTANGTRSKSRFTGFFDQTPKSPENTQSPPSQSSFKPPEHDGLQQLGRGFGDEPSHLFGGRLPENRPTDQSSRAQQPPPRAVSPDPVLPPQDPRDQPRPLSERPPNDLFVDQPPPRSAMTPDINIQNLLATQRSQRQGPDKNSEFLLNLLQTKGSSRPPSQQARPDKNFALWLEQPQSGPETHAPKPRAAPSMPGLYDEHLLRNPPADTPRHDPHMMQAGHDMPQHRTSQRVPPPGFFDEQSIFLQQQHQHQFPHQQQPHQQRRNFTEAPQQHPGGRRMSGHPGLPPMQIPQQPPPPFLPGDFIQSPTGHPQAPPPGFNPHMPRHPPGFHNIPNIFQAPQQQQQQQLPPLPQQQSRDVPGFNANGLVSPPNAPPPGFYPSAGPLQGLPPGFMQMRSPVEGMIPGGPLRGNGRGFEGYDGMGPRR